MKRGIFVIAAVMMASAASAESVAELNEKELNAIDSNNDGFLSKDEFNAFSDYAFQEMDEDKNGTLGLDEAKPFLDIKQFQKADRDEDNAISRAEYDTQMNEDFINADQDGNGLLD
ncbi:hypothetical protein [Roseibium sp. RKSG952]|uniref:hypothetical protein n=1 Tax=Roseibium sp. RKSG952 TaxID=2529384 RepID=UPI0012BD3895|nr:hypothetical protein [Roseibium sp. RKSG952]MTI01280.1 hypothetical protein [Roseibium sp. RKSG952]